jgi:DNA-binding LytR/AlgR family response regulator
MKKEEIEMNVSRKNSIEDYIPVITKKAAAKVILGEILYIETELRVVKIHTISRVHCFYGKIDDVTKYLHDNFYQCHKSCIVNLENIIRMESGIFYFSGGITLQIGQNNYLHTKNQYVRFLLENVKNHY